MYQNTWIIGCSILDFSYTIMCLNKAIKKTGKINILNVLMWLAFSSCDGAEERRNHESLHWIKCQIQFFGNQNVSNTQKKKKKKKKI